MLDTNDFQRVRTTLAESGWLHGLDDDLLSNLAKYIMTALSERESKPNASMLLLLKEIGGSAPIMRDIHKNHWIDLALGVSLFTYDRQLLIATKKRLSRNWGDIDKSYIEQVNVSVRNNLKRGVFTSPPSPPSKVGLSLAMTYNWPPSFQQALEVHLKPIPACRTTLPHLTVGNVAINVPISNAKDVRKQALEQLRRLFEQDHEFSELAQSLLRNPLIRSEVRIMGGGEVILLAAESTSRILHAIRTKLAAKTFRLDTDGVSNRDKRAIWAHMVFSRINEVIGRRHVSEAIRTYAEFQSKFPYGENDPRRASVRLREPRLSVIEFRDPKAIRQPLEHILVRPAMGRIH